MHIVEFPDEFSSTHSHDLEKHQLNGIISVIFGRSINSESIHVSVNIVSNQEL